MPVKMLTGFPDCSNGKESACKVGHPGLIPGLGRSPKKDTKIIPSRRKNKFMYIEVKLSNNISWFVFL